MIRKIREIPVSEHSYTLKQPQRTPNFVKKAMRKKSISSTVRPMSITGKMGKLLSNMQMFLM